MAEIIHAKDLRANHTFLYKNNLYLVLENSFNKTAMREGIVKCKVKNLRTGAITVEVLTGEKLEKALVQKTKVLFSYQTQTSFVFLDQTTYEQIEVHNSQIGDAKNFLSSDVEVVLLVYENEVLSVQLPDKVSLKVVETEQAVQGSTVQAAMKKAVLESKYVVNVPLFIKQGDYVIINTQTGLYVGRDNSKA